MSKNEHLKKMYIDLFFLFWITFVSYGTFSILIKKWLKICLFEKCPGVFKYVNNQNQRKCILLIS